ncbi:zinc finger protein PLAGL1-like [Tachypleus tridentatus]|uniref:zinc finger protein PLAGL1-like n=1 Tax=Tachypleus tridentatus TaxID=6853 RepID=UPI003FD2F00E
MSDYVGEQGIVFSAEVSSTGSDGFEEYGKQECEKTFSCSEPGCGRSFSSKFKMMRHMLIHSGERQFKCSICERCFHRKDHLKNHLQVHNPNKIVHSCRFCNKKYTSTLSYRKHQALHAAEAGDLSCQLCGREFQRKEEIMYHLKVHSGTRALKGPSERKFKCEQCERSFFTRKDVKRHLVVHTGIRNFVCHICPQRFGRKDHLVRHVKKSHGGKSSIAVEPPKEVTVKIEQSSDMSPDGHSVTSTSYGPSFISSCTTGLSVDAGLSSGVPHQLEAVKQEPCFAAPPVENSFLPSGINPIIMGQEGEISHNVLPTCMSQYFSLPSTFNSGIPHFLPSSCFLSTVPGTSNLFPTYSPESMLPPMSGTTFSPPVSLDMGNSALPHFNQAFQ